MALCSAMPHTALHTYLENLRASVLAERFVKLTLTKPGATAGDMTSIEVRRILVKRVQKLSFTTRHATRDIVKNYDLEEAVGLIESQLCEHFSASYLATTEGDWQLSKRDGAFHLTRHAATKTQAASLDHDRAKQRRITSEGKPYLHALGIADAHGKVLKSAQDKFRQINKYIEILDGLMAALPTQKPLKIVDMGAGKGYLTFALYDYLTHTLKRDVELVGVEFRRALVEDCNAIAAASGFAGLTFVEGGIAQYDCADVDVVIALHACDTATDDAIAKAVHAGAKLIVVAPCCHKQIRRDMQKIAPTHALYPMLKHGTYVERMAEMVTDALRAQLVELHGYRTKLFEFISDAHTPKNVMIVAERLSEPKDGKSIQESINRLKAELGVETHALEALLKS